MDSRIALATRIQNRYGNRGTVLFCEREAEVISHKFRTGPTRGGLHSVGKLGINDRRVKPSIAKLQ